MAKRTVKQALKQPIKGTPHRFPPAPENAKQLTEPRTIKTREGWARFAETQGFDWVTRFRENFQRFTCDKPFFTLQDCIAGAFPWATTPEGYMFWREVYREAGGEITADSMHQRRMAEMIGEASPAKWND